MYKLYMIYVEIMNHMVEYLRKTFHKYWLTDCKGPIKVILYKELTNYNIKFKKITFLVMIQC